MNKIEELLKTRSEDRLCPCGKCNLSINARIQNCVMAQEQIIKDFKKSLREKIKANNSKGIEKYGFPP